jgi:hypothetical protein
MPAELSRPPAMQFPSKSLASPLKTGVAPERTREQLERFAASQGRKLTPLTKEERKHLESMIGRPLTQKELDYLSALAPEFREAWVGGFVEDEHEREWEEKDRAKHVLPAPLGFVPEDVPRKIKLTLRIEKPVLRLSDVTFSKFYDKEAKPLRYQALMQNVGREEIPFHEGSIAGSFFKRSFRWNFDFDVVTPQGKTLRLDFPHPTGSIGQAKEYNPPRWETLTPAQKEAEIRRVHDEQTHASELWIHLKPGETLVTKPAQGPGDFRDLKSSYYEMEDNGPGTYKLKLVYRDPLLPLPTDEELERDFKSGKINEAKVRDIQEERRERFGVVESNAVEIEVLP